MSAPLTEGHAYRRVDRVVTQDLTIVFRVIAAIAAAVLVVFGLIALARIDWDPGLDAAAVSVADVTFTPLVAIGASAVGLIALFAAASPYRTSKLVMGALLLCGGIVTFIDAPDTGRVVLEDEHAWMMVLIGAVLIGAAMAMSFDESRRVVDSDAVYS